MGWLDDIRYEFRYECADGHISEYEVEKDHDSSVDAECRECGKTAKYIGLVSQSNLPVAKVSYEQNGRKAFRISSGNGKVTHMSQSKYEFMETGKITTCYTPEFEAHLRKNPEANAHLLSHDPNRREGKASEATAREYTAQERMLKNYTKKFRAAQGGTT